MTGSPAQVRVLSYRHKCKERF